MSELELLRKQVQELLADVELLESGQDPPSVSRTARMLRHDWIDDAFKQRQRAELAEARLERVACVLDDYVRGPSRRLSLGLLRQAIHWEPEENV